MEQLRSDTNEAKKNEYLEQGKDVLEEALEMTRVLVAQPAPEPEAEINETPAEKRRQLRIHITSPIKVLWSGDAEPVDAKLENISWGGAAIHIDQIKSESGDTLQVILPSTKNGSMSVQAKILRTWVLPDGTGYGLATRFSSLGTKDEAELEYFLEVLARSADSDGQRNHARLTQRLDIQFEDAQEIRVALDDISAGGMGITVPEPLQIGQSLQTVISTLDETYSLKLRARVVRQETVKLGRMEVYNAGLKFEHPIEELNELINELFRKRATKKSTKFG